MTTARIAASFLMATLAGIGSASAQEVSFKGQKIDVIIGNAPGGGTDGTSRLVGRFLERYLPGNPQMIYRNMPAGHGIQAVNYFANEAKRDGSAWAGGSVSYTDANTLKKDVVKYDPRTFNFFGAVARGGSVVSINKAKLAALTDKSQPPVVVGTASGQDTWAEMLALGATYLGWNVRFVLGYPSAGAMLLAARRGEIDAFGTSNIQMLDSLAKTGNFVSAMQIGRMQEGKVLVRSGFEKVPTAYELFDGKLSGLAQETFAYWTESNQIDKWYALPPETPAAVVKTYVAAFDAAFKDPEFLKAGRAQFSADFDRQSAAEITGFIGDTSYPKPEILNLLTDVKRKNGLPVEPLSEAELAALAKKLAPPSQKMKSTLDAVEREGRVIVFKAGSESHKANISSSNTKVQIAGAAAKRAQLRPGMTCEIVYSGDGGDAQEVTCP